MISEPTNTEANAQGHHKKPHRYWNASHLRFFDLRLSHLVQIVLTAGLVALAAAQWIVYNRQTRIMATQAQLAESANKLNVSMNRAYVIVDDVLIWTGIDKEPGNPSWSFHPHIKNVGNTQN